MINFLTNSLPLYQGKDYANYKSYDVSIIIMNIVEKKKIIIVINNKNKDKVMSKYTKV